MIEMMMGAMPVNRYLYAANLHAHTLRQYDFNLNLIREVYLYQTAATVRPRGIATDYEGNVLIPLSNNRLVKLDAQCNYLWEIDLGGIYTCIDVDVNNNIYVGGGTSYKKILPTGTLDWEYNTSHVILSVSCFQWVDLLTNYVAIFTSEYNGFNHYPIRRDEYGGSAYKPLVSSSTYPSDSVYVPGLPAVYSFNNTSTNGTLIKHRIPDLVGIASRTDAVLKTLCVIDGWGVEDVGGVLIVAPLASAPVSIFKQDIAANGNFYGSPTILGNRGPGTLKDLVCDRVNEEIFVSLENSNTTASVERYDINGNLLASGCSDWPRVSFMALTR